MAVQAQPRVPVESLKLGAIKRRKRGLRALLTPQTFRRLVQLAFAAFIAVAIVQHIGGETSGAVTASPEAFCPLGGLESLYKVVTTGGSYVPHTHLSNMVVLVAFLAMALLARSAFCGWVCPLGFLQDAMSGISSFLQRRVPAFRGFVRMAKRRGARLSAIDRPLRLMKYAVLVWAVLGAAYFGKMVFRDYDPWAALLSLAELSFSFGTAVLLITLVTSFFVERAWCRYACPLGALGGLAAKLSPVYLE
jgi:polyferredoxin